MLSLEGTTGIPILLPARLINSSCSLGFGGGRENAIRAPLGMLILVQNLQASGLLHHSRVSHPHIL